jgi:transposase
LDDSPRGEPTGSARLHFELTRMMPEKRFSLLSGEGLELVRTLRGQRHDPTLKELCEQVLEERGVHVSVYQISRALRRLGMSPTRRGPRTATAEGLERAA